MTNPSVSERRTILVTGGTGTLGRALVARLVGAETPSVVVLARGTPARAALPAGVQTIVGDVREGASLGLADSERAMLREHVTDIVHCAADTMFNRPLAEARATNVAGTEAVLAFARECPRLERMVCFSTVYVAGRSTGCFTEHDIGGADGFVNSYEQSKAEMESVVRDAMRDLPIAIYRLSTIIGDSRTGEVSGFNAIHHALRLLYQGLAPMVPGKEASLVDLIPVDYAAQAIINLFEHAFTAGATYHICAGASEVCDVRRVAGCDHDGLRAASPAWRKRSIARPAIVDLPTYELFVRSVEEAGNQVLPRQHAVQAFAYQLGFPKVFDAPRRSRARATGIAVPNVMGYYERIVRWCIETNWSAQT
jgi:nucleoside-diphosphate-sugar epimerase